MITIIVIHFIVALIAPLFFRFLGRFAFYILALVPLGSFVWLLFQYPKVYSAPGVQAAEVPGQTIEYIPTLKLELAFRLDSLSWIMCLLVLGVGTLVLAYCTRYFKSNDSRIGAFGAQLLAFAGVMFGLVTADDMILLFIFWELTTILSYLLIGFDYARLSARRAAIQALIVTTFGGLGMLVGLIMIGQRAGTYRISEILANPGPLLEDGVYINIAIALVLLGAVSKSALVPFHFWLPGAMAAPTPTSAYLHAAAMVKAGVYLVARFSIGFNSVDVWKPIIIVLGVTTLIIGGWRALRQVDLKLILAYGTVSQLGFMVLMVGLGTAEAALSGIALVLAHALFKATLFLVVGIIDHQTGTRDIRRLSGLFGQAPFLAIIGTISAASMAGIFPLAGFVAKEGAYVAFFYGVQYGQPQWVWIVVLAGVFIGSVFTFAYSMRFICGAFARKKDVPNTTFPKAYWAFIAPPAILSLLTVLYGFFVEDIVEWVKPYDGQFHEISGKEPYLHLIPSIGWPLLLTVITWICGVFLFIFRRQVEQAQSKMAMPFDAERTYRWIINSVDMVAIWVTSKTQRGSLFFYLAIILGVAIVVPLIMLLIGPVIWPENVVPFDSIAEVVAGLIILVSAVLAIRAKKRFAAVLMVSVTGYGLALIFMFQGAPDLALTQVVVETIVLVAIVLALRSLPAGLKEYKASKMTQSARVSLAFGAGIMIALIGFFAMASRQELPVSLAFPELAYEGGHGKNIVNVTLVDIRAWDTFGEISVLVAAALGVVSLIFIRTHGRLKRASKESKGTVGRYTDLNNQGEAPQTSQEQVSVSVNQNLANRFVSKADNSWLKAAATLAPERRSVMFEVVTRFIFHTIIVLSIFLLFAGHNAPGGGLVGGLTVGVALAIRYMAGGRFELAEAFPISTGWLLGGGLSISALTALFPVFLGDPAFTSYLIEWNDLPVFGQIYFVTSLFFDIGVYLIVIGLAVDVLRSLGARIDEHYDEGRLGDLIVSEDSEDEIDNLVEDESIAPSGLVDVATSVPAVPFDLMNEPNTSDSQNSEEGGEK